MKEFWTPKREQFCREYIIDFNGSDAAIRAGFSARTAKQQAYLLLQMPEIQARIAEVQASLAKRTEITQEMVVAEYAKIAFSDMRKFATWGPDGVILVDSDQLSADDAACISEVSQSVTKEGGSIKFKLHDKVKALDSICRTLGFDKPAKVDMTSGGDPLKIIVEYARNQTHTPGASPEPVDDQE